MLKKQTWIETFKLSRDSKKLGIEPFKQYRPRTVLLTMKKSQNHYYLEKINMFKDESKDKDVKNNELNKTIDNSETNREIWVADTNVLYSDSFNGAFRKSEILSDKTLVSSVPNILRTNTKLNSNTKANTVCSHLLDAKDDLNTSFNSTMSLENFLNKEKLKVDEKKHSKIPSHRRKQIYNPIDIRQESPDWEDVCPINTVKNVAESVESSHIFPVQGASKDIQKKRTKHKIRKQSHKTSIPQEINKEVTCCLTSSNTFSDYTKINNLVCETTALSFLQYGEQEDVQNSIDFSSNNIFNKFGNEFYNTAYANCLEGLAPFFEDRCAPLSPTFDKEYDINGNNMETYEIEKSPVLDERCKENILEHKPLIMEENWNSDKKLLYDKNIKCKPIIDVCCTCSESHTPIHETDSTFTNVALHEKYATSSNITLKQETDTQNNENVQKICTADSRSETVVDTMENKSDFKSLNCKYTSRLKRLSKSIIDRNISSESCALMEQYDKECSPNFYFHDRDNSNSDLPNDTTVLLQSEICSKHTTDTKPTHLQLLEFKPENADQDKKLECVLNSNAEDVRVISVTGNESIAEHNLNRRSNQKYEKNRINDNYFNMNTSETRLKGIIDTNNRTFQCLLCSLTFKTARTMALHQAGAHGGVYAILCDRCGRMFNKKYNFNRHLIHCDRQKSPFNCYMCVKVYRHKSSLIHHLKTVHCVGYIHSSSKVFTCTECSKQYSKFGAFQNHVDRHKNIW